MRFFPKLNLRFLALWAAIVVAGGCKKSSKPAAVSTNPSDAPLNTTENFSSNVAENVKVISARASFTPGAGARSRKALSSPYSSPPTESSWRSRLKHRVKRSAQIWDISTTPKKLHEYKGNIMALSPDGKRMVRTGPLLEVEVADVETGAKIGSGYIQSGNEYLWFRSPDILVTMRGRLSFNLSDPKNLEKLTMREYDVAKGTFVREFEVSEDPRVDASGLSNNGRELVLGVSNANKFKVWDLQGPTLLREVRLPNEVFVEYGRQRQLADWFGFTVSSDSKLFAFQRDTNKPGEILDGLPGPSCRHCRRA